MDAVVSLRVTDMVQRGKQKKKGNQKYASAEMRGSTRLFSLQCMVFPQNAELMSSFLSKQDQDDWLESRKTENEKLEHQVPPTGYSHTDTCRNCMPSTAI